MHMSIDRRSSSTRPSLVRLPGVEVFAHRGDSGRVVENTLGAVDAAVARNADGLEVDVQLLGDGTVVAFHDETLARLAHIDRAVADFTWDELRAVELAGGGRIPSLSQVLEHWPATRLLNVELKGASRELVDRTLAVIGERPGVVLSSFNVHLMEALVRSRTSHAIAALIEDGPSMDETERLAAGWPLAAVHLQASLCSGARVARYRRRRLLVGAWTVNDDATARDLVARGVGRLFTDWP